MNPMIEILLTAATLAPSGDNRQPWRFEVDEAGETIRLLVDPGRDRSPMNAGQRMARIALGAALENLLRTAQANGWLATLQSIDPVTVRVQAYDTAEGQIEPVLYQRVTNRRVYDARSLPVELLDSLARQTPDEDGIHTIWISRGHGLTEWADLIGRGDAALFGAAPLRRAILGNVRFDAADDEPVAEGMSLASLEMSRSDRIALRVMRALPQWLLRSAGAPRMFAGHARQLVASAAGLCLVVAADGREETDVRVGRAMQRAWLALTAAGLAVQPMMSLLVLENLLDHGAAEQIASLGREELTALRRELRRLAGTDAGRPAFLLRFGYAAAPSGRTGRLPWQAVTQQASAELEAANLRS